MKTIICYTRLLPPEKTQSLTFEDILLDDRWTEGGFECSDDVYSEIGNINQTLKAKQNYEFLLRAADKYPIQAVGCSVLPEITDNSWENFRTDCYIVGKYQERLHTNSYFNTIITTLIEQASQTTWFHDGIDFLEKMIGRTPEYYEIDDNTRPILLYRDSGYVCNILNQFIDSLGSCLQKLHQRVIFFDPNREDKQVLTQFIGQHFKAIIGVQNSLFTLLMQDQSTLLHDLIYGPKYNMILDHPAWFQKDFSRVPRNYHILLHDRNYVTFAQTYYPNITSCIHFPPAGLAACTAPIPIKSREYDITFIGYYRNYRDRLAILWEYDRTHRHLAARYLRIMRHNPDYPAEKAFSEALAFYNIQLNQKAFLELFYDMRQVYFCMLLYYKEKVIQTLLDGGLKVHAFSESWENSPLIKHPLFTCHPGVDAELSFAVMQNTKISLNIMSLHKDGLTERVLNSMMNRSVVLSDKTTILEEEFVNNKDLLLFSIADISSLPERIKALLSDLNRLEEISLNGYRKAFENHTWYRRTEHLLKMLDE